MHAVRRYLPLLAIFLLIKAFCPYHLNVVVGTSMEPNLRNGQLCLVDTTAYRDGAPRRSDVVLVNLNGERCVKRVYALPGDTFWVLRSSKQDGSSPMLVGATVPEGLRTLAERHPEFVRLEKMTVPPGCLYLVGDNRSSSLDSRELGWGYQEDVVGRIVAASPLVEEGSWMPPPPPRPYRAESRARV